MAAGEFPSEGMELTHILVVGDAGRSRDFYRHVLGAELYREYGGTSVVLRAFGTWLLLVTGGGPTADKPDVIVNCAGYNNVDGAEDEPERALTANAFAVRVLARAATAGDRA